jgi:hypothetical protein
MFKLKKTNKIAAKDTVSFFYVYNFGHSVLFRISCFVFRNCYDKFMAKLISSD